ncbi:MAG: SDR family NAD(P)-dependent oxidoreductase [Pseudomonadota bacterium]
MFDLNGHVALISGGNGGIGLAFARGLAKCGASLAIWGRNQEKNKRAVDELISMGANAWSIECDVTDKVQVSDSFAATVTQFGTIDSCFANAGASGPVQPFQTLTQEQWQSVMDINLTSVVYLYQCASAYWIEQQRGGKLIVTSSEAALIGMGYAAGYSASKSAVMGLTRALAVELGPRGINVNAVLPGVVETDLVEAQSDKFREAGLRRSCIGRIGNAEDMEGVAVYLASDHSNYMTGQGIVLDGGHSIFPM